MLNNPAYQVVWDFALVFAIGFLMIMFAVGALAVLMDVGVL